MKLSSEDSCVLLERTPSTPPVIAPVPAQVGRPLWSVMIPAYNCLDYLQETMECVLAQDPGPEHMQIVVMDDCSTDGDVRALVQNVGKNRIEYFRHEKNVGSLRNFEACLNRSIGEQVHILHGDDKVMPGFYAEVEMLFRNYPEAGAAFTNVAFLAAEGKILHVNGTLATEPGILKNFLVQNAQMLRLQPPSIVVKRSVYEQIGGFYAVHYGEDWEMWTRIAAHFPMAYSPKCLAQYRCLTDNSITQLSIKSGQNVHDVIKVVDIMQPYLPVEHRERLKKLARREYAIYCASLAYSLYRTNRATALIQAKGALELSDDVRVYYSFVKYFIRESINYKKIKKLWQDFLP